MLNIYNANNPNTPEETKSASQKPATTPTVKSDFKKYQDPTGEYSSKNLSTGMWLMSHLVTMYKLIVGFLIVVNVIVWGYGLVKWGIFLVGWQADTRLENQLARFPDYRPLQKRFAPIPLQIMSSTLLPGGVNKYDAIAEVANTNENFIAKVDYHFLVDGVPTEKRSTVLLAGEARPVAELGLADVGGGATVEFVINAVKFMRISAHQVRNPIEWQANRLNFQVTSSTFTPGQNMLDAVKANAITFNLTNASSYGYIQPHFYVGLYSDDSLVGLMPLTMPELGSGETQAVDIRNFVPNLSVRDIKLFPLINLYDRSVYSVPTP